MTFTLNIHPGSLWKVGVFVHPNREAMRRARAKLPNGRYTHCEAFCWQLGRHARFQDNCIAELHFARPVRRPHVIHECAHAATAWANHTLLNLDTAAGDEHFAETLEYLTESTLRALKR